MKWLEIWAFMQVAGIIVSVLTTIILLIALFIATIKENK